MTVKPFAWAPDTAPTSDTAAASTPEPLIAAGLLVKITPNDKGNPPGKLADVELHFLGDGLLGGLKLIGFAIWERRGTPTGRNVTFPARQYAVNGERRSFALLRPVTDITNQNRVREFILDAYTAYEERAATDAGAIVAQIEAEPMTADQAAKNCLI